MNLNNLTENKDKVFEEVPYMANTLKVEYKTEINEEKICEFIESDENVGIAGDTVNFETIGKTEETEITSNTTENKVQLNTHSSLHNNDCEVNCSKCVYSTSGERNLHNHLKNHVSEHSPHLSLTSEESPYKTIDDVDIEVDLKAPQRINQLNSSESYITTCSSSPKKDMKTHETKPVAFKCQKCDYVTKKYSDLATHTLCHQESSNFRCDKCNFQSKRKQSLVKHMSVHQRYNFQCHICSYQAKRKHGLVQHMVLHQDNFNFQCDKCSYQAKSKYELAKHMLIHPDNCNFHVTNVVIRPKKKTT